MRQIITHNPMAHQITARGQRGVVNGVEGVVVARRFDLLDVDRLLQHELFGERLRAASRTSASPSADAADAASTARGTADGRSHAGLMPAMGPCDAPTAARRKPAGATASKSPSPTKPVRYPPAALWAALILSRTQCS